MSLSFVPSNPVCIQPTRANEDFYSLDGPYSMVYNVSVFDHWIFFRKTSQMINETGNKGSFHVQKVIKSCFHHLCKINSGKNPLSQNDVSFSNRPASIPALSPSFSIANRSRKYPSSTGIQTCNRGFCSCVVSPLQLEHSPMKNLDPHTPSPYLELKTIWIQKAQI